MITAKQVEKELEPINKKLDGIVLSTENKGNLSLDGEMSLSICKSDIYLGVAGISYGLDKYYSELNNYDLEGDKPIPECKEEPYCRAIKSLKNKWIITQMQAAKNTKELREKINFRRILLRTWQEIFSKYGESLDYYLPASLNRWAIPSIKFQLIDMYHSTPEKTCLLMNYDYTAKRNGFKYNSDIGVFQKKERGKEK